MLEYLLSITPFYESRYVIPILILKGCSVIDIIFVSFLNLLVYPFVLIFLDYINRFFLKFDTYRNLYYKIINYILKKKTIIEKYGYIGLSFFVFVPLPTTGVYTASILTWLLNLNRKKAFIYIAIGLFSINILIYLSIKGVVYGFTV